MPSGGRHLRHSVLLTQSDPDLMDNVDDPIRPHKNAVSPQGKGGGGGGGGIYRDRRVKGGGISCTGLIATCTCREGCLGFMGM